MDVGISKFTGAGKVYGLGSPSDLAGTYGAAQSTFAIAGGATAMSMKNENGVNIVILKNRGARVRHAIEPGTRWHEDYDANSDAMISTLVCGVPESSFTYSTPWH